MAVCAYCNEEMNGSASCTEVPVALKSGVFAPVRYGSETDVDASDRCHDCDVVAGGFHHRGCDVEECPACGRQLIWFRGTPANAAGRWTADHLCNRIPVFTLPAIFDGSEVPLLVAHDAEGDWQVLDGQSVEGKSMVVAYVSDVSDLHSSLQEVVDLPLGWESWRDEPTGPWMRGPL